MSEDSKQLDELSKDTLKSYVNKADARTMDRVIDNPKARRKAQNRTMGIEKAVKKIAEDGAVNAAGAGNVAGLGVGPQGEPGVHMKKRKKPVLARFKRFVRT
jgi:dihydroxyacetone kinase